MRRFPYHLTPAPAAHLAERPMAAYGERATFWVGALCGEERREITSAASAALRRQGPEGAWAAA